jgi:hypothetical protein
MPLIYLSFRKVKILTALILLSGFMLVSGCEDEVHIETQVNENGSVRRALTYIFPGNSDQARIKHLYDLPDQGEWKSVEDKEKPGQKRFEFRYEHTMDTQNEPASDFKRFDEKRQKFARNQFQVQISGNWFVKSFEYEERYLDIKDKLRAEDFINSLLEEGARAMRENLDASIKDLKVADAVTEEARQYYLGHFQKYLETIFNHNEKARVITSRDEVLNQIDKEFSVQKVEQVVLNKFPQFKAVEKRVALQKSLEAGRQAAEHYWDQEPRQSVFLQSLNGIYGSSLFSSADFVVRLQMPGQVVSTNATGRDGKFLVWQFQSTQLDQILKASSRKIFYGRILLCMFLALVILSALFLRKRKH